MEILIVSPPPLGYWTEMQLNIDFFLKQLFFVLVATWLHYHTFPIFIITYQIMGIKYSTAEVMEEASSKFWNLRDGLEPEVSECTLPGLRCWPHRSHSAMCSQLRVVPVVFPWFSYHWANNESNCRALCRVPQNLHPYMDSSESLWGSLLIIMPERKAWIRTYYIQVQPCCHLWDDKDLKDLLPEISNHFINAILNCISVQSCTMQYKQNNKNSCDFKFSSSHVMKNKKQVKIVLIIYCT